MEILYSDRNLAVVIKPVGTDSEHGIPAQLEQDLGGQFFPVHRLDLNVGGVMVFARNKEAAASLSRLIADGKMIKEYRAMVHGIPAQQEQWQDLLFKDSRKNKVFVVARERKGVKKASLEFHRLTDSDPSLVHIKLHTGRSHQIRVQFASRGFPLVGDGKYGAKDGVKAPMLWSCRIRFPWGREEKVFEYYPDWAQTPGNEKGETL